VIVACSPREPERELVARPVCTEIPAEAFTTHPAPLLLAISCFVCIVLNVIFWYAHERTPRFHLVPHRTSTRHFGLLITGAGILRTLPPPDQTIVWLIYIRIWWGAIMFALVSYTPSSSAQVDAVCSGGLCRRLFSFMPSAVNRKSTFTNRAPLHSPSLARV